MRQRGMELWLGVFVLVGLGVLATLVLMFGGLLKYSRPTYEVKAEFEKVTGLKTGTPVRMLGIDIGEVKSLEFRELEGGVKMTLEIEGSVNIPKNAPLTVLTEGLLGDNYLEFGAGKGEAWEKNGEAKVKGESFKSPQEYLKEAVSGFKGTAATYEKLVENLNKRLSNDKFFENLEKAAEEAPKTLESFTQTSIKLQELTAKLSGQATEISNEVKKVSEGLTRQVEHQGKNMDKLTDGLLASTVELNKTLASLREVTETVRKGEGTVGGLLMKDDVYKEMVGTLQQTQKMLEELEETVRFVREHPEAFVWGKQ